MDYTELLAALKLYLGIPPEDTENDEALTRALELAVATIETYLDRVVMERSVDEYFQAHFGTVILHNLPVDVTVPVVVNLDGVAQSGYEIVQSRSREAHLSRTGMRHDVPIDWRRYEQVTVTYTAGYDPIPVDLTQAIVYTAADLYKSEGTGAPPGGSSGEIKSMSIQDVGSISYDVGGSSSSSSGTFSSTGPIPDVAVQMLTRYKRLSA